MTQMLVVEEVSKTCEGLRALVMEEDMKGKEGVKGEDMICLVSSDLVKEVHMMERLEVSMTCLAESVRGMEVGRRTQALMEEVEEDNWKMVVLLILEQLLLIVLYAYHQYSL